MCQLSRRKIQLMDQVLHSIIGLRNTCTVEGVGFNQVCTGLQKCPVYTGYFFRLGQGKQIVVTPQREWVIFESFSLEISLIKLEGLDHRSHRAIENKDFFRQQLLEFDGPFLIFIWLRIHACLPVQVGINQDD